MVRCNAFDVGEEVPQSRFGVLAAVAVQPAGHDGGQVVTERDAVRAITVSKASIASNTSPTPIAMQIRSASIRFRCECAVAASSQATASSSGALRAGALRGVDTVGPIRQVILTGSHGIASGGPAIGVGAGSPMRDTAGLGGTSRLDRYFMDAAPAAKAGYAAMRAGRVNVIPGVGTKIMRAMSALSPSRRFTGELSGRFVSRH